MYPRTTRILKWIAAPAVLLAFALYLAFFMPAAASETELTNPPAPQCPGGALLWQQTVDVTDLDPNGIPNVAVRFTRFGTNSFAIPGPLPAAFGGPVVVQIAEAVAWDGYVSRASTADQPNERFKIVFLLGGSVEFETGWTGVSAADDGVATGWVSDEWVGSLGGPVLLPNGADTILLVHWSDVANGTGDKSSPNSVVPTSVCINYSPPPTPTPPPPTPTNTPVPPTPTPTNTPVPPTPTPTRPPDVGTGTPGYWMNHPEAWPADSITIGGIVYTKDQAIALMKAPVQRDKSYTMFSALVAAKLNVMIGTDPSCINGTIAAADAWMAANPVGSGVRGNSDAWKAGEPLSTTLDNYNNGRLCAPSRDSLE